MTEEATLSTGWETGPETSLADAPPTVPDTSTSTAQPPAPEAFDFTAWLSGVEPIKRSTRVYARGDLVAVADRIADELNDLARDYQEAVARSRASDPDADPDDDDDVAAVTARYDELRHALDRCRADYDASGLWWTVQGRSAEWLLEFRREYADRRGIKLRGGSLPDEHAAGCMAEVIAAMTVEPAGITPEQVAQFRDRAPLEVAQIEAMCSNAITQPGARTVGMTADFSPGLSTNPAGRAS